ncbi:phosphonopyruvate decarboxylase [Streptomyces chumphonensis]|uniref:Phosphonopyruvate decarboxylase n=1 Tax=Streptomyces chumphonensis TaxID=1214925 RepID=A0A927F2N9_9ACTN|nr:phosphonopyruvate decarboxylase [Streptomyces chumphonensis]MBD3934434.1 phosphonopyruvate decarboxylase [Streptomyces chumphonensis]
MITAQEFVDALEQRGFTASSGVPCSHFGGPIALLGEHGKEYVPAANEGGALAVAAGFSLAGRASYIMLQNSGLGNLINPLTSLVMTYRLPVLTFVSMRGWPDPADDEPQHEVMGPLCHPLLDTLGLPHWTLRADEDVERYHAVLDAAVDESKAGRAPFVLVERGAVGKATGCGTAADDVDRMTSVEAIRIVRERAKEAAVISTTGYTSREVFAEADGPNTFYMQGSMGHASALALGVALAKPARPVVVLDGDGAALMHLGTLSVIGDQSPTNLVHVVLDNGIHESTGGQRTTSGTTSFPAVAKAMGYRHVRQCTTPGELDSFLHTALESEGPHLCAVPTRPRSGAVPPRATSALSAEEIKKRFIRTVTEQDA